MKDTQDTNKIKYVRAQLKYIRMLSEEYNKIVVYLCHNLRKANFFFLSYNHIRRTIRYFLFKKRTCY